MKYEKQDVINAKQNIESGFENLYESIYVDLYKLAYYIIADREMAQDVVSETVIDAFIGIRKLKDVEKFEQWILRILNVKCKRKMHEKYERISVHNPNVVNLSDYEEKLQDNIQNLEELTDMQTALFKLNVQERMIVSLCVIEGYKSHEAAKILHMNPSTVRSKLNRSLNKMKEYLEV